MRATTRRSFLSKSLGAAAALATAPSRLRALAANDAIGAAVVGFHGHGKTHINAYRSCPGVRLVALCDADRAVLKPMVSQCRTRGEPVRSYVDVRKLLEDPAVDVVSTATPNHWHALVTVWACQAGKHVCVEKPVSWSLWEGRKMVQAARKYKRLVQADLDLRSDEGLAEAVVLIQQGFLGRIVVVRGFCYKRRLSIGKVKGHGVVPKTVDYNLWCGPAPAGPLRRTRLHYDWHWVWETGNGEIGNNGPHQLDLCRWVLGHPPLPRGVMSIGGRFGYDDDGQTPNTHIAFYDTGSSPIIYEVRGLGRTRGDRAVDAFRARGTGGLVLHSGREGTRPVTGVVVECEGGWADLTGLLFYDRKGKVIKRLQRRRVNPQHNFIKAVRSGKREDLRIDILQGHLSTALSHMGNTSHRLGKKASVEEIRERIGTRGPALETFERFQAHLAAQEIDLRKEKATLGPSLVFDPQKERFVGPFAEQANKLLRREYREPFVIPDAL